LLIAASLAQALAPELVSLAARRVWSSEVLWVRESE